MPSNIKFKKRNLLIYTIPQPSSDIKDNRDIDVVERSRNLHLLLGKWKIIYCSAEMYQILDLVFRDNNHFTVHSKSGESIPWGPFYDETYILGHDTIYFSIPGWPFPFSAACEISERMLVLDSEFAKVMCVKNDNS